jgi:hypothetical protein
MVICRWRDLVSKQMLPAKYTLDPGSERTTWWRIKTRCAVSVAAIRGNNSGVVKIKPVAPLNWSCYVMPVLCVDFCPGYSCYGEQKCAENNAQRINCEYAASSTFMAVIALLYLSAIQ